MLSTHTSINRTMPIVEMHLSGLKVPDVQRSTDSTWVLPSPAPLDEADDEEEEHDDGHGTHDADQPALGGEVHLVSGIGWRRRGTEADKCVCVCVCV